MSDQGPEKAETAQEALDQESKKPTTAEIRKAIGHFGGDPDRKKTQRPTQEESAQKESS